MEAADRSRILNINIGVLGHVDSGKTSLVKALSTSLSTAALDKNPQSQQRGITLDLGFSAFTLPLPDHLSYLDYDFIQFTLVDCPGHASLIRTIIGGAQIIDMILLVVDANKGIQTQTAECIVIGEITTDKMIVVLNKVDMIPEEERDSRLEKVTKRVGKVLSTTKFADAPIIYTAAAIGGEKVAAVANPADLRSIVNVPCFGVDRLVSLIRDTVQCPVRNTEGPLYFAIDHCFAIKGHGTVVTGTVLSGSVSVNSTIEIPHLQIQRKVKSMQMFKKPVKIARQGDRVGMCVTNLDPVLIERGVAASPDTVQQLSTVLCLVKKVRFFKSPCRSNTRFHISIGHSTVIGNVVFFGALEIAKLVFASRMAGQGAPASATAGADADASTGTTAAATAGGAIDTDRSNESNASTYRGSVYKKKSRAAEDQLLHCSLNNSLQSTFPDINYQWDEDYQYQEELMGIEGVKYGEEPVQWAVIQLQQPVFCPLGSLVIGSRLDTDTNEASGLGSGSSHQCRLSFFGPVKHSILSSEMDKIRVFNWKLKEGEVFRLTDVRQGLCYELIGSNLLAEHSSVSPFIGMKVETERGQLGTIAGSFASDGKFRVKFPTGIRVAVGSKLRLRFKKFVYDKTKVMEQTGIGGDMAFDFDETSVSAEEPVMEDEESKAKKGRGKSNKAFPLSVSTTATTSTATATTTTSATLAISTSGTGGAAAIGSSSISSSAPALTASVTAATPANGPLVKIDQPAVRQRCLRCAPNECSCPRVSLSMSNIGAISTASASFQPPYQSPGSAPPVKYSSGLGSPTAALSSPASPMFPVASPVSTAVSASESSSSSPSASSLGRYGIIESVKAEVEGQPAVIAIVKDAFKMEENIRQWAGATVVGPQGEIGELLGPFAKMGKCKVKFPSGLGAGGDSAGARIQVIV